MTEPTDDPRLLAWWSGALPTEPPAETARKRLFDALENEPHLPFCAELARHFSLQEGDMRALLARIADPSVWTRGIAPFDAFYDFSPGSALSPLRGGFVRLSGGAHLPRHRHAERELTYVLEGEMVDDAQRRYGPGSCIDMPVGSIHSIGVPPGGRALVALLHGRIEMVP